VVVELVAEFKAPNTLAVLVRVLQEALRVCVVPHVRASGRAGLREEEGELWKIV